MANSPQCTSNAAGLGLVGEGDILTAALNSVLVDIFETNGRIKRYHRLRSGIGLAVFPTREEAIRAADALCL
jgi:hypothetical protein